MQDYHLQTDINIVDQDYYLQTYTGKIKLLLPNSNYY